MKEVRHSMWFDLFGQAAPEALKIKRDFVVVRRRGSPFLYLPVDRRAAGWALALYPAQSRKARLAKKLLAIGLRIGQPGLLGLESFSSVFSQGDLFANYLSKTSGVPEGGFPLFAVLRGNPEAEGRRDVFLLFGPAQQPVAVVKAGHSDAARALIAHEEAFLKSLPPGTAGVPQVRSGFSSPFAMAFAMDFIPGESPTGDAMIELESLVSSWLDTSNEISLAELPAWQRLLSAVASERMPTFLLSLGGMRLHPTLTHGDLAPWNVKVSRGEWTVLDWERGELAGVPGWDWFHFVMQSALLVRREGVADLLARFERLLDSAEFLSYAQRAGIGQHRHALALAYLANCLRATRQTEGQEQLLELERVATARWFSGQR